MSTGVGGRPAYPSLYASLYPWMQEIAKEHGYALAIHGSLRRDMDVIAVPWIEDAADAEVLVAALVERIGLIEDAASPAAKPHGRRAYGLVLSDNAYVDLSVLPK